LANVAAVAGAGENLVLLGDPQQLAQVSQAYHPGDAGGSVLEHLLGDRSTIPREEGLFLEQSWRMHPQICAFISDLAYDGRLQPAPGAGRRRIESNGLNGAGLRYIPIEHAGNRQSAPEEAARISEEVELLLADGWVTDAQGERRPLIADDVLVVAAYNHQVSCLSEHIRDDVVVGTVDKFQGQEAPVVFYSLATSAPEDAPRGIDFLFSRNRLNVAISRAQCIAALVGNPALLDADCRTVEQMRLVNGACRYVELASV
jgi:superfamily I DNA and/or RNA helicase